MEFVTKAPKSKEFRRPIGELPDSVVDLDPEALLVSAVDVRLHLFGSEERVVDVRVDLRCVVDVDGVCTGLRSFIQRLIAMIESRFPLRIGINELERCYQE